jgi:hypothetical protein
MGSVNSTNTYDLQNNILNQVVNENFSKCGTTCQSDVNNTVNIIKGNVSGNFVGAAAQCSANSTCLVSNSIDSQVSSVLASKLQQQNNATVDLFGDFASVTTTNVNDITNSITNLATQIIATACNADSITSVNNTFNYLSSSSQVGGNYIGAVAQGDVTNYCTINNLSKLTVYNQIQTDATQTNKTTGMFAIIFIAIIVVAVVIGIVILLIVISIGGFKAVSSMHGKSAKPPETEEDALDKEIKEEEEKL